MDKPTNEVLLHRRAIKSPNFIYNLLGRIWQGFVAPKYNLHYTFKTDFRKEKGPCIFISNHASRLDYIFVGVPLLPGRYNFVAGYNEFYRSHLAGVFRLLRVIPKKNFVPDIYTARQICRILCSGGRITLFPEGMSSISGANQPVAIGTGHLIKHEGLPVYCSVIRGGYLTSPKYNLNDRPGYVEVEFDRLFTPEEIAALTPEEIEDRINERLYHDDYAWNLEAGHHYAIGDTGAEHLEDLLFWCPRCGGRHTMKGEGNRFLCTACGNGMTLLDTYEMVPLDETSVIPRTQTEWFRLQREEIRREVAAEGYTLTEHVTLGMLPEHGKLKGGATSLPVGEGTLTLDRSGLTYDGTRNSEPFCFHIDIKSLPTYGMCTDLSRFYTFYNGQFMEFYPEHSVVEEFFLATEELHRQNGGRWQDFKFPTH